MKPRRPRRPGFHQTPGSVQAESVNADRIAWMPRKPHMPAVTGALASLASALIALGSVMPCAAEVPAAESTRPLRHLFILSGQSNMTAALEAGFRDVMHRELGEDMVSIVRQSKPGRGIRFWVENYELPEDHPFHGRLKAGNGEEFPKMLAAARSAGDPGSFATVTLIWMQGESDASRNLAPAYGQSFKTLVTRLKGGLGIARMHFVIGRISDHGLDGGQSAGWKAMRRVQVELADSDPLGAWIDTDDLNGGNADHPRGELHYPADRCPELGARFAEAAIRQLRESNRE